MAVDIWFTSDTHYGHTNILQFESVARPFATVEEMNEEMIKRWNNVVHPEDTVYHIGDFCFGRRYIDIAKRLQGRKRLVMGNHDCYSATDYLQYFDKLYGVKYLEQMILSHVPVHSDQLGKRCTVNVHGHLHSKKVMLPKLVGRTLEENSKVEDRRYFNVSVEHHNLTPVHIDVIRERIKEVKGA